MRYNIYSRCNCWCDCCFAYGGGCGICGGIGGGDNIQEVLLQFKEGSWVSLIWTCESFCVIIQLIIVSSIEVDDKSDVHTDTNNPDTNIDVIQPDDPNKQGLAVFWMEDNIIVMLYYIQPTWIKMTETLGQKIQILCYPLRTNLNHTMKRYVYVV